MTADKAPMMQTSLRRPGLRVACVAALALLSGCGIPSPTQVDQLLIGEVMLRSEFAASLRKLSVPGGRLSGTPNAEAAERFVADQARSYGLSNVHFEPFEMQCWISHETEVTVLGDPPRVITGALALGKTISTPPEGVTAEVVSVGEGQEADFQGREADLAGRFLLAHPDNRPRRDRVNRVLAAGAAGLLVMSGPDRPPHIGNGHESPRPEPIVAIPHDQDLLDRLQGGERPRLNVRLRAENWAGHPNNVVAEIPGRGPQAGEVVIVAAHLDSWHLGEGAIDNGNGSAVILEAARALARTGWQPRRTVRFVWFAGEELGLRGSEAYVQAHRAELGDVVVVINVDMPGSPRSVGRIGECPQVEPVLQRAVAELAGYELDPKIGVASGGGSDDAPFVEHGVAVVGVWGELGPGVKHYHTSGDTYETVDTRGTTPSAAVIAVLARRFADEAPWGKDE